MTEFFRDFSRGIIHGRIGIELSGIDPEQRQPARVGIGDGFENNGRERGVFRRLPFFNRIRTGLFAFHGAPVNGRGEGTGGQIREQGNADAFDG